MKAESERSFFSPGKLLLTSEYAVLDGALALAVPTQLGQELSVVEMEDGQSMISWNAFHQNQPWLSAKINYQHWEITEANIPDSARFVLKVLKQVQKSSALKFQGSTSYEIQTNLQFPADFGLGSSSTLMTNLSDWAEIDAFELNASCLGGSGYDIAVAQAKSAIFYRYLKGERKTEKLHFQPEFRSELIFIHLNRKQDSRKGIEMYRSKPKSPDLIAQLSALTHEIFLTGDLEKFSEKMEDHECRLSEFLGMATVKEKYFENAPVFVKSLGAWGGDFVLSRKFSGFREYFSGRDFSTIFEWDELIL
ncbi:GYDIA family GHMP kinase [Chryseobacterium sp. R2A-55]|uniref:GYDIA family GHMP kinase n=1 Tax=Chryseobacterium sp. R2A-55 TaxID=2744445 RepID=UPI001F36332E|nr:GYDIA family GHMP kinase [Chryseobacterium sp. R2A-55]